MISIDSKNFKADPADIVAKPEEHTLIFRGTKTKSKKTTEKSTKDHDNNSKASAKKLLPKKSILTK